MANDITLAYQWAVDTCNAANVGYSQNYRNEKTVGGITYYDCSSFIWYALKAGGFPVETAYLAALGYAYSGNAITTHNERAWLSALGFEQIDIMSKWEAGDVVWRSGHTEMVWAGREGEGITMGAHTANASLAEQVSINKTYTPASKWTSIWRYSEQGPVDPVKSWIYGNRWLSLSEMRNNADIMKRIFITENAWSVNAFCGMLGNMQKESSMNPGIWQNLDEGNTSLGYGLVQWTPSTNITDWLTANGYAITDGDAQCLWILTRTVPEGQWIPTSDYPETWSEFIASEKDPEYLAYAFMNNFERPKDRNQPDRKKNARYWYNIYYNNDSPTPEEPNPPGPGIILSNEPMPIYMYLRTVRRK